MLFFTAFAHNFYNAFRIWFCHSTNQFLRSCSQPLPMELVTFSKLSQECPNFDLFNCPCVFISFWIAFLLTMQKSRRKFDSWISLDFDPVFFSHRAAAVYWFCTLIQLHMIHHIWRIGRAWHFFCFSIYGYG